MPMCGPVPLDSRPSGHYPHNNHSHINLYPLNIIYVPTQILKQTRLGLVVVQPSNVNHSLFSVIKATLILQMSIRQTVCHQNSSVSQNCSYQPSLQYDLCLLTIVLIIGYIFSTFKPVTPCCNTSDQDYCNLISLSNLEQFQFWFTSCGETIIAF